MMFARQARSLAAMRSASRTTPRRAFWASRSYRIKSSGIGQVQANVDSGRPDHSLPGTRKVIH